jgi:flagellar FliJ protein
MAQFRFKLEAVLRQREIIEEQKQRELAMAMRQRMIFMEQLKREQEIISESKKQLSQSLTGRVNLDAVSGFARFSGQTTMRAQQIVNKLASMEPMIEKARQALMEAVRNRKALDLLKEKHKRAWQLRQDRLEAAVLDEMAVQRHARALLGGDDS